MNTPEINRWRVCFLVLLTILAVACIIVIGYGVTRIWSLPRASLSIHAEEQSELLGEMRFVASSRGKYYYPVLSERGQGLSPKYRLYFESEEEAKAAGFIQWKPR